MNPWPVDAEVDEVHLPRPGHADLAGVLKFGHTDVRNVLERAQRARDRRARGGRRARQGVPARARGRRCAATSSQIGAVHGAGAPSDRGAGGLRGRRRVAGALPRRRRRATAMVAEIDAARKANESLGGVFEVLRVRARARARLARLLGGAPRRPARPGDHVDPGDEGRRRSATASTSPGGSARRPTTRSSGREERGYYRETNRAGGIEGGMTTGEPVVVRGAMKPLPTLTKPLRSVDIETQGAGRRRCASAPTPARCRRPAWWARRWWRSCWPRAYREKFGGDHIDDVPRPRSRAYEERIGWRRA